MTTFTNLTGIAGITLALAALSGMALERLSLSKRLSTLSASGIFVLLLLPFGELPLAAYVRGMTGDLSITTLLLIGYVSGRRLGGLPPVDSQHRIGSLLLLVLAAYALYPLALGATAYDPYRLGYGEPWFLALLLTLALTGSALRLPFVALSISLAVLAWAVGWYESCNLWDYLIDPALSVYALLALLKAPFGLRRPAK